MENDREFISLCVAVAEGRLSPSNARAKLLGRRGSRAPDGPVTGSDSFGRGTRGEPPSSKSEPQDESIEIFRELFVHPTEEFVRSADEALAAMLVEQRLISPAQADECLGIQEVQFKSGQRPLSRLGDLLLQRRILVPGAASGD